MDKYNQISLKKELKELIMLHNNAPYVFTLYTKDGEFVDCNDKVISFFAVNSKEKYIKDIARFIPKTQADGSASLEVAARHFEICKDTGNSHYEFILERFDGLPVSTYTILQNIEIQDTFFIVSYQFSLSSVSNLSDKQIDALNNLLRAITEVSKLLLVSFNAGSYIDMDKIMFEVLKTLGTASRADRCYIWENYTIAGNTLVLMKQIYEWVNGVEAVQGLEIIENVVYEPALYDLLSSKEPLNAIAKDLDEYNRMVLEEQDVKSILLAPIHIGDYFWGFIGFDNCKTEELWEFFEQEVLLSASSMIGTVLDIFKKLNRHSSTAN